MHVPMVHLVLELNEHYYLQLVPLLTENEVLSRKVEVGVDGFAFLFDLPNCALFHHLSRSGMKVDKMFSFPCKLIDPKDIQVFLFYQAFLMVCKKILPIFGAHLLFESLTHVSRILDVVLAAFAKVVLTPLCATLKNYGFAYVHVSMTLHLFEWCLQFQAISCWTQTKAPTSHWSHCCDICQFPCQVPCPSPLWLLVVISILVLLLIPWDCAHLH